MSIPTADNGEPTRPRRTKGSVSTMPATTGGMTSRTNTTARVKVRPGKSVRAKTSASGTPRMMQATVAAVAVRRDSHSASSAAGVVSSAGNSDHVIPANNATNGTTKNTPASTATPTVAPGTPADTTGCPRDDAAGCCLVVIKSANVFYGVVKALVSRMV